MRFLIPVGIVLLAVAISYGVVYHLVVNVSGYRPWVANLVVAVAAIAAVICLVLRWWDKVDGAAVKKYHESLERDL